MLREPALSLRMTEEGSPRVDAGDAPPQSGDLTVVVPCFNEARRLPQTLEELTSTLDGWGVDYRVLVVDDGSRDGTAELAERHGSRVQVLRMPGNRGKGS